MISSLCPFIQIQYTFYLLKYFDRLDVKIFVNPFHYEDRYHENTSTLYE